MSFKSSYFIPILKINLISYVRFLIKYNVWSSCLSVNWEKTKLLKKFKMESSKEIILITLGLLIVIFAGTLALRLGISLRD